MTGSLFDAYATAPVSTGRKYREVYFPLGEPEERAAPESGAYAVPANLAAAAAAWTAFYEHTRTCGTCDLTAMIAHSRTAGCSDGEKFYAAWCAARDAR